MADEAKSILSILESSRGYDVALLTTFNFEIDFFEKAVLNRLLKNEIRKVSVYVDSKELAKAVSKAASVNIGVRYVVNPVEMQASFHPKIILLLGEKKARLIVGSGNMKTSGYYINNEVFGCIDYDSEQTELRGIISDAIRYFEECDKYTPRLDKDLLSEVHRFPYYRRAAENDRVHFLGNGTSSILEQVKHLITGNVEEIKIAVPYYDNGLTGLQTIRETWPLAECRLFLQHRWSTYQNTSVAAWTERVFECIGSKEDNNSHFYHGKVFLFRTEDSDYLLYGSSNCTQSAFTKSKEEGGNCECDILIKGNRGEYESFYSQFIITDKQPEGHPMVHENNDETNFYFRYGVFEKKMILHIGFVGSFKRGVFSYRGSVLPWKKTDGEILIEIEGDQFPGGTFDLEAEYDDKKEVIKCWYIDRSALGLFRIPDQKVEELTDSEDFGEGDKFRDDYEKLLRAMGSCSQDWYEIKQSIVPYLAAKEEEEGAERAGQEDSEEDYIVTVSLSDEDYSAYRQFCTMERIRNKVTEKYLHSLPLFFREKDEGNGKTGNEEKEEGSNRKSHKITQVKRFKRFVRRIVRNISDPSNVEDASREHYIGIVAALFSVFDDDKNEGLFDDDYLIRTRCDLILAVLTKFDSDTDANRLWISRILDVLLHNHSVSETFENADKKSTCEQCNRRVLLALEKKYHIRNSYAGYFILSREYTNEENRRKAITYFEQLYGYRDIHEIESDLRKHYGSLCGIKLEQGVARVDILSENPENFLKPDPRLIRDLKRYSANVQKLSTIIIIVKNPKKKSGSSIIKVEHRITLSYNQWKSSILRANGQVQNKPSAYLQV